MIIAVAGIQTFTIALLGLTKLATFCACHFLEYRIYNHSVYLGMYTPLGRKPPRADTPRQTSLGRHPSGQTPL